MYDPAHRLIDIKEILGNHLHYTLDAMGNRTTQDIKDASGNVLQHHEQRCGALSRLKADVSNYNNASIDDRVTSFAYYANGEPFTVTEPNGIANQPNRTTATRNAVTWANVGWC